MFKKAAKGFTLVELLIVIAIIAILAAVVVLIVNPIELTRRGRDAARLTDLANIQQSINVAVQEATDSTDAILCNNATVPCNGSSNGGGRDASGAGWVKVNLKDVEGVSVPVLPIDPANGATNHYVYCSDGAKWKIMANLESQQQKAKEQNDGGEYNGVDAGSEATGLYEVGSDLSISCSY